MRPRIPGILKEAVIEKWLRGISRNKIAEELGIGRGTVSAIINEWIQMTGKGVANQLRDLALALHGVGLSINSCVTGLRISLILRNLGLDIDDVDRFLAETFAACFSMGLKPGQVAELLEDVASLSDGLGSMSAMSDQIKKMREENENLMHSIAKVKVEIETIHVERKAAEERCKIAQENESITKDNLTWYINAREELRKFGIPVDDIPKLAKVISWINEQGYDAMEIVKTFSEYGTMKYAYLNMEQKLGVMEKSISGLEEKKATVEKEIGSHIQILSLLQDLSRLGIGIKELKSTRLTINEIASANGMNTKDHSAWKTFFTHIEQQYDPLLGFERKINEQKIELRKLVFQVHNLSEHLGILVADSFQFRWNQEQKLNMANVLNSHPDIAGRVASYIERSTLNNKKKEINKTERNKTGRTSSVPYVDNGDIAGFDARCGLS